MFKVSSYCLVLAAAVWSLPPASALAQPGTVSGTVTGDGEPLPGATISVVNTLMGTTSDNDGNYSLSVPSRVIVLRASFVGFATQEATIAVYFRESHRALL